MSIKHKCQLVVIGILSILLMSFSLIGIIQLDVKAEENQYFTCNQYTETDYLLMADGSDSSKNIQTFATEVKSASIGTEFPELSQVIPLQYLETTETNAEFSYNGKEYGFYMAKEGNYFDVLLIDFVYEFDDGYFPNFIIS